MEKLNKQDQKIKIEIKDESDLYIDLKEEDQIKDSQLLSN